MGRGRKPLATAVKEASGAYRKDPQRRNRLEPQAKRGWPEMPELVAADKVASEYWHRVCAILDELNILTTADVFLLEQQCLDYSQFRYLWTSVREGSVSDDDGTKTKPEAREIHKYMDRMVKRMAELGLTPSARSRLHVPQTEDKDPFQAWLEGDAA
jgi:P27 family predicted phage terminase small subunit